MPALLSLGFVAALVLSVVASNASIWIYFGLLGVAAACLVAAFRRVSGQPQHTIVTVAGLVIGGLLAAAALLWSAFFLVVTPGAPIAGLWKLGPPPFLLGFFLVYLSLDAARR